MGSQTRRGRQYDRAAASTWGPERYTHACMHACAALGCACAYVRALHTTAIRRRPTCFAFARSLISRSAASRAAARTSGFWLRFCLISSSEAPTTALGAPLETFRLVFFWVSSRVPFLCILRYRSVQAIFLGLNFWWKYDFDFRLMNRKDLESPRTYLMPWPG